MLCLRRERLLRAKIKAHRTGTESLLMYFDGQDPTRTFEMRVLPTLGGVSKAAANELETTEIVGEKGKDNIIVTGCTDGAAWSGCCYTTTT